MIAMLIFRYKGDVFRRFLRAVIFAKIVCFVYFFYRGSIAGMLIIKVRVFIVFKCFIVFVVGYPR